MKPTITSRENTHFCSWWWCLQPYSSYGTPVSSIHWNIPFHLLQWCHFISVAHLKVTLKKSSVFLAHLNWQTSCENCEIKHWMKTFLWKDFLSCSLNTDFVLLSIVQTQNKLCHALPGSNCFDDIANTSDKCLIKQVCVTSRNHRIIFMV